MNAELLAMLGSVPGVSMRTDAEPKTLLSFKAGKMKAESQPNGKYLVTADPRRGTLEVCWTSSSTSGSASGGSRVNSNANGVLKLEWRDRRTRSVIDSIKIFPEDECYYSKVDTGQGRDSDRVYLLQFGNQSERRYFFWMQEKEEGNRDEEFCVKINSYMADPEEAAAAAAASGEDKDNGIRKKLNSTKSNNRNANHTTCNMDGALDGAALQSVMQGIHTETSNNSDINNNPVETPPVDALSNILENLGMPQPDNSSSNASEDPSEDASASAGEMDPIGNSDDTGIPIPLTNKTSSEAVPEASLNGGLTLSDLQGAMAGLATTSPTFNCLSTKPGPPLSDVLTPSNIIESGIFNDDAIKSKLIALLPEGQQSEDHLMDNIRSAQVQQCLKNLTAALCEDISSGDSMEAFNSILANFHLRPEDGAVAMASGNPIRAFLDCVLKSVQREKDDVAREDNMCEGVDEDIEDDRDGDGDTTMKE